MARDQGHPVEIRPRIRQVVDGATRWLVGPARAGSTYRTRFLSGRLPLAPASVDAPLGAPS